MFPVWFLVLEIWSFKFHLVLPPQSFSHQLSPRCRSPVSTDSLNSELRDELRRLSEQGLLRSRREVIPLPGGQCRLNGQTLWNFASNDYLGLADDPRLKQAAIDAIQVSGIGARASPLVTGRTDWHARLESAISRFKQTESAILFPTGFAANLGTIGALAGPDDIVICDRLNHASLIDGIRQTRARLRVIPHGDVTACRQQLQQATGTRRRLIVTDSVFSMDGDHAPLRELHDCAEEFDAILIVDDAHATGVFGDRGTGLLEVAGISASQRVISIGTLSKAIGLQGGFVAGSSVLINWLWNSARTQVYSTALSIPVCAAAVTAFELITAEPERRHWLRETSSQVIAGLRQSGWHVPDPARGPILPVLVGDAALTMQLASALEERGILVAAIRPPTVPAGTARLRVSLCVSHGQEGIAALLDAFQAVRATQQ